MLAFPSDFEHTATHLSEIEKKLQSLGADKAVLKLLHKNANDKNQIYWGRSFSSLYNNFNLTLAERGTSSSLTKDRSTPGSYIPEAVFNTFSWVMRNGTQVKAQSVKVIVYTQYPEARLSGFLTIDNTMPQSLSVNYTKANPDSSRLLVLGRLPGGACLGLIYIGLSPELIAQIEALPGLEKSKVCKVLKLEQGSSEKLFSQLSKIVSRSLKGCRLNAQGETQPFTGTQVCGYTLEHALGIIPNAGKDGDLYGIELKTHTRVKVTLFTPEPDFGLYAESFETFMRKHGYQAEDALRLTGLHRANQRCEKSGLTLQVREYHTTKQNGQTDWVRDASGRKQPFQYNPATSLTAKMHAVEVVLTDDDGWVAAGWSLERLMNNWGVKHNEVMYLSASKADNPNQEEFRDGYKYLVTFSPQITWCRETSAEHLLNAINSGVIYLDPAPKFVPENPSQNKRRAQWRVNDINKAITALYKHTEIRDLMTENHSIEETSVMTESDSDA